MSIATFSVALADHFQLVGLGTVGSSIFQDQMLAGAEGLLIIDTGGPARDRVFGSTPLTVQISARKATPAAAKALAHQAYAAVGDLPKTRIGGPSGVLVLDATAIQPPFGVGKDDAGKLWRYVFNARFTLTRNS